MRKKRGGAPWVGVQTRRTNAGGQNAGALPEPSALRGRSTLLGMALPPVAATLARAAQEAEHEERQQPVAVMDCAVDFRICSDSNPLSVVNGADEGRGK